MKSVFVGMSGGVDSSLTAALLKEQGYKVFGVYMKNWTQDLPGFDCPWKDDFHDAKRVAVKLGIDLQVFDFEKEYRHRVVDYMIREYADGRTPNPDVMCNQEIKFKLFLDTALERGADMIATGHYARTVDGKLLTANNSQKDQTYFLYRVQSRALEKTLFPIGEYSTKDAVRSDARRFELPTANKKDSQGICFVGKVGIKEFLSRFVETEPGPIIDASGKEIGTHDGAIFYTIGQRHGLNVGGGLPYYVSDKDMKTNTVFVTTDLADPVLWASTVITRSNQWINQPPQPEYDYSVRFRYRGPLIKCNIKIEGDETRISIYEDQRAISPGQSAVVYDGDNVIGGGIISQAQSR